MPKLLAKKNKLSVVLTSYNYEDYLADAIDAVLRQTLMPDDFFIIDDGSTDDSVAIIKKYTEKYPFITLIENKRNQGVIEALNKGLEMASGEYIAYASADDIIFPELFEISVEKLDKYPSSAFSTALVAGMDKKGNRCHRYPSQIIANKGYNSPGSAIKLLNKYGFWTVGNPTVFRRKRLIEHGGFRNELGPLCDSFVCQVLAIKHGFYFIPKPLAKVRVLEGSYSLNLLNKPEESVKYVYNCIDLMQNEYKEVFPNRFINKWEGVHLFFHGLNILRQMMLNKNTAVNENGMLNYCNRPFSLFAANNSSKQNNRVKPLINVIVLFFSFFHRIFFNQYFYIMLWRWRKWISTYLFSSSECKPDQRRFTFQSFR